MAKLRYYAPGAMLILMSMLIVAVPEILLAFVSCAILLAGVGALSLGHMIRKSGIA